MMTPILPIRSPSREELEISGQRVLEDATGAEIGYVTFDEDAEYIVKAVNGYERLLTAVRYSIDVLQDQKPDEVDRDHLSSLQETLRALGEDL